MRRIARILWRMGVGLLELLTKLTTLADSSPVCMSTLTTSSYSYRTGNSSYSSYMPDRLAFMNSSQPPNQHIKDGQMPVPPGGQEEFGSGQHNPSSQMSGPSNGHPTSSKPYNSHTSPLTH
ncbi:hypothetical protein IV203_036618 [Nitzschia inconspicua]|uniref:Uncharacterized protein n=1 Tax=Nitzschia inconspicua TaxID=303405 RepID=A0A9K3LG91_9STRA|nr:hypothetical protein IV203_036618 [Nitzschia inconspicua]